MSDDKIYYVYTHYRPDKGVCFYVGKGKRRRAWNMHQRNPWHKAITSKLTSMGLCVDVRIIQDNMSHEDALALEAATIAHYGKANLTNLADGGCGPKGSKRTPEQIENIREARRLYPLSDEAKRRIGASSKLRKNRLGQKASPETRASLREIGLKPENKKRFFQYTHLGPMALSKRVICVDDGNVFESVSAAAKHYGIKSGALSELCNGKKGRKTLNKRVFRFIDEDAA